MVLVVLRIRLSVDQRQSLIFYQETYLGSLPGTL